MAKMEQDTPFEWSEPPQGNWNDLTDVKVEELLKYCLWLMNTQGEAGRQQLAEMVNTFTKRKAACEQRARGWNDKAYGFDVQIKMLEDMIAKSAKSARGKE